MRLVFVVCMLAASLPARAQTSPGFFTLSAAVAEAFARNPELIAFAANTELGARHRRGRAS